MAITIKCKIDKVPFNYLGSNEELDFSHKFEELADFLAEGCYRGIEYEVELPDGKIMKGNHTRAGSIFQDTFGCSIEEWREQQRSAATEISIDDLFEGKKPQDITAYHIKAALETHNNNGENVCVEWNGRKCYSVDAVAMHNNFIERVTGVEEYEYEKSLKDKAKYISSVGLSTEEIAKAMVEAHERGLNVYTRIMVPEISDVIYSIHAINENSVYRQAFGETKKQHEDALRREEQGRIEDRQKVLEKREALKSLAATPHPELKNQATPLRKENGDEIFYFKLESMAKDLLERAQRGENVFYEFNGIRHYTCEISNVDDIYKKQLGVTYEEHCLSEDKWREDYRKKEQEKQANLPQRTQELYEKGLQFIDPSVDESRWRYCVDVRCSDIYGGADLKNAMDIMESLSKSEFERAAEIFDSAGHSGASAGMVMSVVRNFRPNDFDEFQKAVEDIERSERTQAD